MVAPSERPSAPEAEEEHPFGKPPKDLPDYLPGPATRAPARDVELQVVDLRSPRDRKRFVLAQDRFYSGDANYVPHLHFERMHFLDPDKSACFRHLEVLPLLAYRDGQLVGRLTAHIDTAYDQYHGVHVGWFGFFECVDDRGVAHALFERGMRWLKERGVSEVIGPSNFNTNHPTGLLVENFKRPPMLETTYNRPYYEALITSFGFGKAKDLYTWWVDVSKGLDNPHIARIHRIAEKIKKREQLTLRNLSMKSFARDIEQIFTLYNEAWQKNWGFAPVTRAEFEEIAEQLKPVAREEFNIFVEVDGKPVAFVTTLPDINELMPKSGKLFPFGWYKLLFGQKRIRWVRLFTLGVIPGYRKRGLESLLFVETALRAKQLGYDGGEVSWTLEDNVLINRGIESMGGTKDRVHRLFGMRM